MLEGRSLALGVDEDGTAPRRVEQHACAVAVDAVVGVVRQGDASEKRDLLTNCDEQLPQPKITIKKWIEFGNILG